MGCQSSKSAEPKKEAPKKPESIVEKVEKAVVEEVETCLCWEPCLYPECFNECSCPCGRAGTCLALCVHKATGAAAYDVICCDCCNMCDHVSSALKATTKKEREAEAKKAASANTKKPPQKSAPPKKAQKK